MEALQFQNTQIGTAKDLSPIGASNRATGSIETMRTIHWIHLNCLSAAGVGLTRAQMITDIASITVKMNGVPLVNGISVTELLDLYKYWFDSKVAYTPVGNLSIPCVRNNLPVAGFNRAFGWGMKAPGGGQNSLTIEIVQTAGLVTLSQVEVYYEYDLFPPEPLGQHVRLTPYTRSFTGTGILDITDLPKEKAEAVLAYHFHDTAGTMTSIEVIHNNVQVFERVPMDVLNIRAHRAGRTRQANYFHVDFAVQNDLANGLPMGVGTCWQLALRPSYSVTPGGAFTIIEEGVYNGL